MRPTCWNWHETSCQPPGILILAVACKGNPKAETRDPKEIRIPKARTRGRRAVGLGFRRSDFYRVSDLGLRISNETCWNRYDTSCQPPHFLLHLSRLPAFWAA